MIKEWLVRIETRYMLWRAFRVGGIFRLRKRIDQTYHSYPRIKKIALFWDRIECTFILPGGLDPLVVWRKKFLFHQFFGKNLELVQESEKVFILKIYNEPQAEESIYRYAEYEPYIKDFRIPIVVGKDNGKKIVAYDMSDRKPTLLINGEQQIGKTTLIRSVLTTLMQSKTSQQLKIFITAIDSPEYEIFKSKHHVVSVNTTMKDILSDFTYLKVEIMLRWDLLERYNAESTKALPFGLSDLLIVIDEYTLVEYDEEVQKLIDQILKYGGELGIYLIVSTKFKKPYTERNFTSKMIFLEKEGRLKFEGNEITAPNFTIDEAKIILNRFKDK